MRERIRSAMLLVKEKVAGKKIMKEMFEKYARHLVVSAKIKYKKMLTQSGE